MNEHSLHPANVGAAAVLIGGAIVAALPQYAFSILRLVIVTAAAAAALYAVASNAPPRWWRSPFARQRRRRSKARAADDIDWIRSLMASPRQRIARGPAVPPQTIGMLQPLIRARVDRHAVVAHRANEQGDTVNQAEALLSPLTRAVLSTDLEQRWWRLLPPDEHATASVVHHVLDDLERLAAVEPAQR